MQKTVIAIFDDQHNAEHAINSLQSAGYNPKDISVVMRDKEMAAEMKKDTGSDVVSGATAGAATGAIVGGLAGLVASFAIPGLGAFFIGGPIAAALGLTGAAATTATGAATGALAGGLIGGLTNLGLSEEEAKVYEERVNKGGILVAIPTEEIEEGNVTRILNDNHASDITTVSVR